MSRTQDGVTGTGYHSDQAWNKTGKMIMVGKIVAGNFSLQAFLYLYGYQVFRLKRDNLKVDIGGIKD